MHQLESSRFLALTLRPRINFQISCRLGAGCSSLLATEKNSCVPENYGEPRPWFGVRAVVELRAFGLESKSPICFALRYAASTT